MKERLTGNPEHQLQAIEYLLSIANSLSYADRLEETLKLGNSAYAVAEDKRSLEWRADPTFRAQVERVVGDANQGASHWLAEAWNHAYGRTPLPGPAYDE